MFGILIRRSKKYTFKGKVVFYEGKKIDGCIKKGFNNLKEKNGNFSDYITTGGKVYYQNKEVIGADYETFETIPFYMGGKDINYIYREGIKVKDSDGKSYEDIKDNYSRDINNLYFLGRTIEGANPSNINFIENFDELLLSSGIIYFRDEKTSIDVESIKYHGLEIVTDKNFVYHCGNYGYKKINGSDGDSFRIIGKKDFYQYQWRIFAKDKNQVYVIFPDTGYIWLFGKADPKTFEVFYDKDGENYGKDKNGTYLAEGIETICEDSIMWA